MNPLDLLLQVWPLAFLAVVVYAVRRHNRQVPRWERITEVVLAPHADGSTPVPVAELARRRFLRSSRNSISPRLAITGDGLRFKVFREDTLRFDELKRVHAVNPLFRAALLVFERPGDELQAQFAKAGEARALLRALPAGVPLSPAAMALRDAAPG